MFEKRKLKKQVEIQELKAKLNNAKAVNALADKALTEARFAREDPDAAQWTQLGVGGYNGGAEGKQSYDHYVMLDQAYRFYKHVLHGRAVVRNLTKFVLGVGPTVTPKKQKNKKVEEEWVAFQRKNKWNLREKEIVRRAFRDGEVFLRWFVDKKTGDSKVRFIRANTIKNPVDMKPEELKNVSFGIKTDPNDIEEVISYFTVDVDGNKKEEIPAEEITHIKIESDSDEKRGTSYLLIAMPMIEKYNSWLDDRIALNKVRSAIALIKTIEGDKNALTSIRDATASKYQDNNDNKVQAYEQGTVLTATRGIKYDMLSPNIQAQDVKDDGRSMLVAVAAGVGLPEMFLTADFSNSNFSSSMIAQNPFVREIEDWQDFYEYALYKEAYARVIYNKMMYGSLPKPEKSKKNAGKESMADYIDRGELDCIVEYPPLITADIKKNNEAREIQFRNKTLSRKTWMQKENLDFETEVKNMKKESEMEIFVDPFQLAISPANQYSGGKPGADPKQKEPDPKQKEPDKNSDKPKGPGVNLNQFT